MKKYSVFCFLLIGVFYIIQVSVLGFTVYYLTENGYNALEVGILLAIFGIVAVLYQQFLGRLADKNPKVDFKSILTFMGFIVIVLFLFMYFMNKNKLAIGFLFGIAFVFINCMLPFVNVSCFYYTNKGINVDFGKVRGIGSLSFAVASYVLGIFSDIYGARLIAVSGIISSILFSIIIILMPRIEDNKSEDRNSKHDLVNNENDIRIFQLIKKYPTFFLMVLATIFAMCFQNADCGYLIKIIEGLGGSAVGLGQANAIAAIVEIPTMFMFTRVMKKVHIKKLIAIACAFYILRGFIFCIPSIAAVYFAQVLQMFTFAILIPSTVYLADEMMHEEDKNKGHTFIGMAVTSGLILGNFVGGQLISCGGVRLLEFGCVIIAVISFIFALIGNVIS